MNEQNPSSDIRRKMQKPYVIDIGRKRQTIGLNQISQGQKRKKKKKKNTTPKLVFGHYMLNFY